MKKSFLTASLFFLIVLGYGQKNTNVAKSTKGQSDLIFDLLKEFPDNTQFAMASVNNGEVRFQGVEKKNGETIAIDNKYRVFEIGSISKVFTATLLANAVLEQKVSLDDTADDHLDFDIRNDYKFKLGQLANHTSRLPRMPGNFIFYSADPENPYKDYGEEALKEFFEQHITLQESKTNGYEYSNLGAGLLGYILSTIYSKEYGELLNSKIFEKFKMTNSYVGSDEVGELLVKGLDKNGSTTSNWNLNVLVGAGGILSNVDDLSRFLKAQLNNENAELSLTRKETYKIDDKNSVGLGWHIKNEPSSKALFWHNGGTGGYRSCMVIDVENRDGIIILSNVSAFHENASKIDNLAFDLLKTLD